MNATSNTGTMKATTFSRLLYLCDCLFLISMLVLPLAWIYDPLKIIIGGAKLTISWGIKPILFPILTIALGLGIRAWFKQQGLAATGILGRTVFKKITLLLVTVYLSTGLLEFVLAEIGFNIEMAPVIFALENSDGETEESKGYADPELRWKFTKGEKYHGTMVNSLGYRGREVSPEKEEGTIRVICMGDSVTAQGEPGYTQCLHELLEASPPTSNKWEAFNMAVYGYSSVQGLRVFQLQTANLAPDVVSLYFGWNDHWLEMRTDRDRMAKKTNPIYGKVYNLLKTKRFFMLLTRLFDPDNRGNAKKNCYGFRVPPDEYRDVLEDFISEIRAAGAIPLIITAARRNVIQNDGKVDAGNNKPDYNKVHDEYVEIARQTASKLDVDMLDLHKLLDKKLRAMAQKHKIGQRE